MHSTASKRYLGYSALAIVFAFTGCSQSNSTPPTPPTPPPSTPSQVTVSLNQSAADVAVGSKTQFTATVKGSSNTAVTWSVDGVTSGNSTVGTVSASGLYTAPSQPGAHTVMAASVAQTSSTAKAAVTVVNGTAISPSTATLDGSSSQSQQFTAAVTATSNTAVNWSVDNIAGGNSSVGTISASGLYTAPGSAGTHTITATSAADASSTASATVTVFTFSLSPGSAVIAPSGSQQFTANIDGLSNTAVSWSVDGVAGGNASTGMISSTGSYTAPASVGPHQISATSAADSSATAGASLTVNNVSQSAVLTYHNDDARDGAYLEEVTLTPSNVNSTQFGKLASYPVDGQIYSQPLYLPQVNMPSGTRDVVFVETQNNSVYAFDADASGGNTTTFWHVNFGAPFGSYDTAGPYPNVGILSTPVIDASTNTLYLVAEVVGKSSRFYLHALNVATGADQPGSPVGINATYNGDTLENGCYQRMGLALNPVTNWIYIAFGSCTHGWVLAYDKSSLAQEAVFDDTNGGAGGGLWASGGAPAIDDNIGNVYLESGTDYDDQWISAPPTYTQTGYNDSFLSLNPTTLDVQSSFSPDNNYTLSANDADLGSGSPILVAGNSQYPLELVGGGKDGNVFVVNPLDMGGFASTNGVIQTVQTGVTQYDNVFSTPVYWNGKIYFHDNKDVLRAYSWNAGGSGGQQLSSKSTSSSGTVFNMHGATPSLSANGSTNGIIWDIDNSAYTASGADPGGSGPAVLHAYDATNVANELYNSAQAGTRDQAGLALKFTVPTIANGRVFVPTASELDIYGLLTP
jgi:hypothetical protein